MQIETLFVENFRNLKKQTINFSPNLNVLCGKNAQGKTNTLEAIYLSTIGRSLRTRKDGDMICFDKNSLCVDLGFSHKETNHSVKIFLKGQQKQIFVDEFKLDKISDVIGNFGSVYFTPETLTLVQGGPSIRRRFLDIINCQLSKNYLKNLQAFQRLLTQRNALLKTDGDTKFQIHVWDEQLAKIGTQIYYARQRFCAELLYFSKNIHKTLSGGEELSIDYISFLENDNTENCYKKSLKESYEKDKTLGYTTFGIQNDDFVVKINSKDVRKIASQGQQRTVVLSLKLAELEILKQEYGAYPVLLLDDVFSELDITRRQKLLEYISGLQCILTCTDFDEVVDCKRFLVEDGVVME